jgi:hypothetical protein
MGGQGHSLHNQEPTAMEQDHETLRTNQARAGETPHIVRYILLFSVTMVVVIFAALLFFWSR